MSDISNVLAVRNGSADLTFANGAAIQTVVVGSRHDDKIVLIVRNTDANPATINVAAGDYVGASKGGISKAVVQNALAILGPFDGSQFKNMAGKFTVAITDADGSSFAGTVANVKIAAVALP